MIQSLSRVLIFVVPFFSFGSARAQGLPVDTGSPIPVALMFIGAAILGIVLAYGVIHNRGRSRVDKAATERATEQLKADEPG